MNNYSFYFLMVINIIQGYSLGNPLTFPEESNYQIPFCHGMGLISNELYEVGSSLTSIHILTLYHTNTVWHKNDNLDLVVSVTEGDLQRRLPKHRSYQ